MRTFILLILIAFGCGEPKKSVRTRLEGIWSYEPPGDTILYEREDGFADYPEQQVVSTEKYIIRTDSGIYELFYEDKLLKSIQTNKYIWVNEYIFQDDQHGILLEYKIDTSQQYKEHPRIFAQQFDFELKSEWGQTILLLTDGFGTTYSLTLSNLTQMSLISSNSQHSIEMFRINDL